MVNIAHAASLAKKRLFLASPFLPNEDAVGFLKILRAGVRHVSCLDLDVDLLVSLTLAAVEFQPDVTVFQRPDLSQYRLAVWALHFPVSLHKDLPKISLKL